MIDIHSHIIPKVDDGSKSVDDTIKMAMEAEKAGFTSIIVTPHFMKDSFDNKGEYIKEISKLVEGALRTKGISVGIIPGMEIYIFDEIKEFIENGTLLTLGNSRYILIEFPMNSKMERLEEILFKVISMGFVPIIAHPERYSYVKENYEFIEKFVDMGCLLQSNYGSIIGDYGKEAQKTVKQLLKHNLITFLGTDTHRPKSIYAEMPVIIKKLSKIVTKEKLEELTTINPSKIINNEEIY